MCRNQRLICVPYNHMPFLKVNFHFYSRNIHRIALIILFTKHDLIFISCICWSSNSACLWSYCHKVLYSGYCLFSSSYGMCIYLNIKLLALKYMMSSPCYYFFLIFISMKSCEWDTLSWVSYIKGIQVLKFVLPSRTLSNKRYYYEDNDYIFTQEMSLQWSHDVSETYTPILISLWSLYIIEKK